MNDHKIFWLWGVVLLSIFCFYGQLIAQQMMPLTDIKPGMMGKSHTVIQGSEIVELDTEILGVMWNYLGPDKHVILGRLVDERTVLSGAVHGMSGSPLYIDGKLVGALAYRIGAFEKDGHCGFTPIADMLAVQKLKERRRDTPFFKVSRFDPLSSFQGEVWESRKKSEVSHLSLPLSVTGWRSEFNHVLENLFPDLPVMPVAGGSVALEDGTQKSYPLKPGSALSAVLISGDITAAGTGTLTWRSGDEILGFGHPIMGLGEVQFPLASAEILSILPSYMRPHKISNVGKMDGTIRQDRGPAIAGKIGALPEMGTYHIQRQHEGITKEVLEGGFAKHRSITPQLLLMIMIQSMVMGEEFSAEVSLRLKGKIHFKDHPSLVLDGAYSGSSSSRIMALMDQGFMMMELLSDFSHELDISSLELDVQSIEEASIWEVEKIVTNPPVMKAGEKAEAVVTLKNLLGDRQNRRFTLELPEHVKGGMVGVYAGGGDIIEGLEKSSRLFAKDMSAEDAIYRLNQHYQSDQLFLRLVTNEAGVKVGRFKQTALPRSVLSVMAKNADSKPDLLGLKQKVWLEDSKKMNGVIKGVKMKQIKVEKN